MSFVTYRRFDPTADPDLLPQVIACYQDVFSTSPWFEWKTCTVCRMKWGREQAAELHAANYRHCGEPVVEFWSADVVARDISKELAMPGATCWLAMDNALVIGFCWGYVLAPPELEQKLGIACAHELAERFGSNSRIAYQDEIGVSMPYRGKRIASVLFERRLHDFLDQGLRVGVVRTKTLPASVTYLWFTRLKYQMVAEYNDADGRVILAVALPSLLPPPNSPLDECSR